MFGQLCRLTQYHFNPLNTELNPICHLLALLGAHHIFHVSGLRVKTVKKCVLLGPNTSMKFFTFTISAIHILLHTSFVTQSDLQQVHSPFHRELYTECHLVLPLSSCSIFFLLKVIQYLLTSSLSSSRPFYLSCNNVL